MVAAILATLLILAPAASAATSVSYAENGEEAVATFNATDQDGDDIEWSLGGRDMGDFEITPTEDGSSAELSFKKSPNYESPVSSAIGNLAAKNVYMVDVKAAGGSETVTVTVTDEDEDGKVSFSGQGRYQPQVGRTLSAGVSDPDNPVSDERWQWARGPSSEGPWTDIDRANSASRSPAAADEGMYLRATVTYTDKFGSGKTELGVTENSVETQTVANTRPSFAAQDGDSAASGIQVSRTVDENAAVGTGIGKPVDATEANDGDVLVYTLDWTPDLREGPATSATGDTGDVRFTIDRSSGQIKVGKELNFEETDGEAGKDEDSTVLGADETGGAAAVVSGDTGANANDEMYILRVRATDPSGAYANVNVIVSLKDVNEAPTIPDTREDDVTVVEGTGRALLQPTDDGTTDLADDAFGATDQDAADDIPSADAYAVEGADKGSFEISDTGDLTIKSTHTPDFEKQDSYSITITAIGGEGGRRLVGSLDVTIKVTNAEDDGKVSLTQRGPQEGRVIVATLSDQDGGVTISGWQWRYKSDCTDIGTWEDIPDAESAAYTPKDFTDDGTAVDIVGQCLQAVATYTDEIDDDTTPNTEPDTAEKATDAVVQAPNPANAAPEFPDQDPNTSGDQSDSASRTVAENTKASQPIGAPVTAEDKDSVDNGVLLYTLGGADAASFSLARDTGQLSTKAKLDFETKDEYMVMVTAMDPSGASDSIMVTIMVTDENDGAVIAAITEPALNTPPAFSGATAGRNVDENLYAGAAVGDPVVAEDDAGDTVIYSIDGSDYFDIDTSTGQIMTTMKLDEEAMSSHSVTVTATDEDGETDSVAVTITVNDSQPGCDTVGDMGLVNDCEALLDSKDALGGSLNWADDTAMSDWDGVTMSDDRVTAVNLREQGLDGTISGALGRLSELTSLNLRSNSDLSGEIPGSLNYLSNLTVLNLHSNSHTGEIPDLSGTSLVELYLPGNDLTGEVPAWLNTMTDMTELWLWGNDLSGTMPDLSDMASLDKLKLNGNTDLNGIDAANLPGGLRWLIIGQTDIGANAPDLSGTSLTTLWMNETGLSGVIPVAGIPTSVTSLNLKDNSLSGTIPDLSGLVNLQYLRLHRNDLSGDIPGTMGDLDSIERIWLYENDLTGIAAGFGNAADTLTHLYLDGNSFAEGTCLPGDLADVANNDFDAANLAACQ